MALFAGLCAVAARAAVARSMPRHTEWSQGLLQANRLWAGAPHELGQAAPHRRVS